VRLFARQPIALFFFRIHSLRIDRRIGWKSRIDPCVDPRFLGTETR
jgi:hypothetical protein